jgi:hypothetical protein
MNVSPYLDQPTSEKRIVQCHGCVNVFWLCKLHICVPKDTHENRDLAEEHTKITLSDGR